MSNLTTQTLKMEAASSFEISVTIYHLDYIHPEEGRHERTAYNLKMEPTSFFDTAVTICQLDCRVLNMG
jgi:hypothetical protein